jgi:hypothetical protein
MHEFQVYSIIVLSLKPKKSGTIMEASKVHDAAVMIVPLKSTYSHEFTLQKASVLVPLHHAPFVWRQKQSQLMQL